jgi:hypothetical protein
VRKTLTLLSVFAFAFAVASPVLAAPPKMQCSFLNCCRSPCGTWCVDAQGSYHSCWALYASCDGACDLSTALFEQSLVQMSQTTVAEADVTVSLEDLLAAPLTADGCGLAE